MTRSFAEWATDSRVKTLACVFASAWLALIVPFAPWLPGALIVLLALVHSPVSSLYALVLAAAALLGLLTPATGVWPAALLAIALLLPQYLVGRLLRRGASMNVCFQFTALAALAMLVVVYLVINDPAGVWRGLLTQWAESLDRFASMMSNAGSGRRVDEQQIMEASAARLWGAVGWLLLLNTMVSALVGQYWARAKGHVAGPGSSFGELSAGRTLAVAFLVCAVCAALFTSGFCTDALMVFGGVFVLQGLSILHSGLLAFGFGGVGLGLGYAGGFLVFLLVSLSLPALALAVQFVLFASGFFDNWYALRPRIWASRAPKAP